jgi:hypothetical protein
MAGLVNEHDRQRLLTALSNLDHQLAIALELFADAGFSDARTARFILNEKRVNPEILVAAMVDDEIDHHPLQPDLSPDDQKRIGGDVDAAVHRLNVIANSSTTPVRRYLGDADRDLLARMDLTQPAQLTQATRLLADAGLDIDASRDVLADLGVTQIEIDALLQSGHYNPATGHYENLWPSNPGTRAQGDPEQLTPRTAPPQLMVRRVANTAEPPRPAQHNDTNELNHVDAIGLRADAGHTVDVVAGAAIANRNTAVTDLQSHRPDESVDWYPPPASSPTPPPMTAADVILREWDAMRLPPTNAPSLA